MISFVPSPRPRYARSLTRTAASLLDGSVRVLTLLQRSPDRGDLPLAERHDRGRCEQGARRTSGSRVLRQKLTMLL